jgi:hypothetical protein
MASADFRTAVVISPADILAGTKMSEEFTSIGGAVR